MNISFSLSNISTDLWIACIVITAYFILQKLIQRKGKHYPPGPVGLPVVGYLPFLTDQPHIKLHELAKKYGSIFSLYLGSYYTVVFDDIKHVRDTFNKFEFHGRMSNPNGGSLNPRQFPKTISSINGREWLEQRKFTLHHLKGYGKGKNVIEDIVKEEVLHLLNVIEESKGRPVDIKKTLTSAVSNVISKIILGKSFPYGSDMREFFDDCVEAIAEYASQTGAVGFLPWIEDIPILNRMMKVEKYKPMFEKLRKIVNQEIEEHKTTFDANDIRDAMDAFILEMKNSEKDSSQISFDEEMLAGDIYTLFGAGSETVRTSIDWTLFVLATRPDIQEKVHKEINETIGKEKVPSVQDQKLMPYTMSVLMEIQRLYTIIPVNIIHCAVEDTKVDDFDIPKGTVILSNLWAIHRNPEIWENPEEFRPERFLDKSGKSVVKPESYVPFSYGKRVCPGESMAMMEIFIFVVSISQKFQVKVPEGADLKISTVITVSNQLDTHELCFLPRI